MKWTYILGGPDIEGPATYSHLGQFFLKVSILILYTLIQGDFKKWLSSQNTIIHCEYLMGVNDKIA